MKNATELKDIINQLKEDENKEKLSNSIKSSEKIRKYNGIASRIFTISFVLKWLGTLFSIITLIFFAISSKIALGLLYGLMLGLTTFIIATFLDGFAEIIQLLEDIKNK